MMAAGGGPHATKVRFGLFELDVATGKLCKEGRTVRVQELPFGFSPLYWRLQEN
jgi:hypothetical protein